MKQIALVAGGTLEKELLPEIQMADYRIGLDFGAWWLLENAIVPDEAIGDFDSVTSEQLFIIEDRVPFVTKYPKEKDFTDLELGLERAASMNPTSITIFGGTGSRFDQTLASVFLLEKFSKLATKIIIKNATNEIQIIKDNVVVQANKNCKYCSLISLSKKSVISLKGFLYTLEYGALARSSTLGISNELVSNQGEIIIHTGKVLFIRSSDA